MNTKTGVPILSELRLISGWDKQIRAEIHKPI